MATTTNASSGDTAVKDAITPNAEKMFDPAARVSNDARSGEEIVGEVSDWEKQKIIAGNAKFHRLGWKRLTVVLIVTAVALGSLSLPAAFATVGMIAGVILCVGIGLIAVYTAYIVGQVKVQYPQVAHYGDAAGLMFGKVGSEVIGVMLTLLLLFLTASHCLTGTIAFATITESNICGLVWGVVSAVLLFIFAVPPSFAEVAILGYIDFASIMAAIFITIIATGIQGSKLDGGLQSVNWSAWPKPEAGFTDFFIAICNIFFAYSFCISQFSFMDEMHTPTDYMKSIWALGALEILIYTMTGAVIYAFVGVDVKAPALLSAGNTITKVAFGVALPVIFISGSINMTVAARYVHGRIYEGKIERYVNTTKGWLSWLSILLAITVASWIVAEAIPFFSDLVAITSSLLNTGFTLYLPALMWFLLLRKGKWNEGRNLWLSIWHAFIFILGIIILVGGTYSAIQDIIHQYQKGTVKGAFSCSTA